MELGLWLGRCTESRLTAPASPWSEGLAVWGLTVDKSRGERIVHSGVDHGGRWSGWY